MIFVRSIGRAFDQENPWVRILADRAWRDALAPIAIVGLVTVCLAIGRAFRGVDLDISIRLLCFQTVCLLALTPPFHAWMARRRIAASELAKDLQLIPACSENQEWALYGQALRATAVMAAVTVVCCAVIIGLLWTRLSEAEVWNGGSGLLYWRIDGWGWGGSDDSWWPPGPLSSPVPLCVSLTIAVSALGLGAISGFLFWALVLMRSSAMRRILLACPMAIALLLMIGLRWGFYEIVEILFDDQSRFWGVVLGGSRVWNYKMHLGAAYAIAITEAILIGSRALILVAVNSERARLRGGWM